MSFPWRQQQQPQLPNFRLPLFYLDSVAVHPIMIDVDVEVRDVYDEEVIVDADVNDDEDDVERVMLYPNHVNQCHLIVIYHHRYCYYYYCCC